LPGVRTSYSRGIRKLPAMSAFGRLPTLPCRKTTVSRYRRQWDGNGAFARVKPVRETLSDSDTGRTANIGAPACKHLPLATEHSTNCSAPPGPSTSGLEKAGRQATGSASRPWSQRVSIAPCGLFGGLIPLASGRGCCGFWSAIGRGRRASRTANLFAGADGSISA
jgi:hypothetical protein